MRSLIWLFMLLTLIFAVPVPVPGGSFGFKAIGGAVKSGAQSVGNGVRRAGLGVANRMGMRTRSTQLQKAEKASIKAQGSANKATAKADAKQVKADKLKESGDPKASKAQEKATQAREKADAKQNTANQKSQEHADLKSKQDSNQNGGTSRDGNSGDHADDMRTKPRDDSSHQNGNEAAPANNWDKANAIIGGIGLLATAGSMAQMGVMMSEQSKAAANPPPMV